MAQNQAELEGKMRQFYRLLMAYQDFHQAYQISSYILRYELHEQRQQKGIEYHGEIADDNDWDVKILLESLSCAMVVAYCRPFSGSEKTSELKIPDLPKGFLKIFDEKEKGLHERVMNDRNKVLAHSDSSAWDLMPYLWQLKDGKKILMPLSNDPRVPLTLEQTVLFNSMAEKLREHTFNKRMELEKELIEHLPVVTYREDGRAEFVK